MMAVCHFKTKIKETPHFYSLKLKGKQRDFHPFSSARAMNHAHHRNLQPLPLHHWIWWPTARTGVQVLLRISRKHEA
ncbi:hypothetical protein ES332_A03G045700v1 [Gossypium tomentosum]|nr:hypothetical protein ES332_A03G045700v1 [Gossypium tomentosum]